MEPWNSEQGSLQVAGQCRSGIPKAKGCAKGSEILRGRQT